MSNNVLERLLSAGSKDCCRTLIDKRGTPMQRTTLTTLVLALGLALITGTNG
jgi:hypothetical protein